jgi:type IV secretion system protein VirB9
MIRPAFLVVACTALIGGCTTPAAAAPPVQTVLLAARLLGDPPTLAASAASPVKRAADRERARPARIGSADRNAVREPSPADYVGAAQVYPWSDGALYRLYAAPGRVSDIALQPGEMLVSVAAGDTLRWIIGDTSSGSGATRRSHILVKPSAAGLSTNLVIATDRRTYHVEAESRAHAAMAGITWTYPEDALVALRGASAAATDPVSPGVSVDQLDFDYRIEGDNPDWRPVRAFDDGRQVFIQFPPGLAQGEAPPLFVTGDNGRAELINYRIRGLYYVVDRLFAAAELRMGGKRQQVVRIVRGRRGR